MNEKAEAPVTVEGSPVRVTARLDAPLSRWLWLVKWLLVLPHAIVLAVLWVAVLLVTVVALFAVLFTGRYPDVLFDFVVGVLRWTWRAVYYAYGALGTDRYPPFSLGEVPDYPATLHVERPNELSRGLVLVKWWLLVLPHYLILAAISGTGGPPGRPGLTLVLVLIAAVALLFTGRYPGGIYDLVVGVHRWSFRVAAYALLLTDVYPPFRLDQGGAEPAAAVAPPVTAGPVGIPR